MTNLLFPRLPLHIAMELHEQFSSTDEPQELRGYSGVEHPQAIFTQTGGNRYSVAQLRTLKEEIESIAIEHGYPKSSSQSARAAFDSETAIYLNKNVNSPLGELLRDEMWMFMTAVMFPHLVKWRFPNFTAARVRGGVRNVFQRLWERAYFLDRGEGAGDRWELVEKLSEDAFVAILERPVLSADPKVARAIGEGWLRCAAKIGAGKMEDVHRSAVLQLRARFPVIAYAGCDDQTLGAEIDRMYEIAAGDLSVGGKIRNLFKRADNS